MIPTYMHPIDVVLCTAGLVIAVWLVVDAVRDEVRRRRGAMMDWPTAIEYSVGLICIALVFWVLFRG